MEFNLSAGPHVFSVSEINAEVAHVLDNAYRAIWIEGEISNLTKAASGHWYFTLKDQQSQLRCAMFKQRNRNISMLVENGMLVKTRGNLSLYQARGEYQCVIDHMEESGEGLLQKQLQQLDQQLHAKGWFTDDNKKSLPHYPTNVALISSNKGAAHEDVLQVLKRRASVINVQHFVVPVQGQGSSEAIAKALQTISSDQTHDAIIIARGGGSLEDLWAFNELPLLTAMHHCSVPIISGVGHETDVTLCDKVADVRASTPSAAAEIISQNFTELPQRLDNMQQQLLSRWSALQQKRRNSLNQLSKQLNLRHPSHIIALQYTQTKQIQQSLQTRMTRQLQQHRTSLAHAQQRLKQHHPQATIDAVKQRLSRQHHSLDALLKHQLHNKHLTMQSTVRRLELLSPLKTLTRGYSISTDQHQRSVTAQSLKAQQTLINHFADGTVTSTVEQVDLSINNDSRSLTHQMPNKPNN